MSAVTRLQSTPVNFDRPQTRGPLQSHLKHAHNHSLWLIKPCFSRDCGDGNVSQVLHFCPKGSSINGPDEIELFSGEQPLKCSMTAGSLITDIGWVTWILLTNVTTVFVLLGVWHTLYHWWHRNIGYYFKCIRIRINALGKPHGEFVTTTVCDQCHRGYISMTTALPVGQHRGFEFVKITRQAPIRAAACQWSFFTVAQNSPSHLA